MSNLFAFAIPDSPTALLATYGAGAVIRVQSSPTEAGLYGDVDTLPIETGVTTYTVFDEAGVSTDWYKVRYEAADGDPAGTYADAFQPMQLAGVYASLAQFELFIRDSDTADRDLKLLALDASSRAIDRATNRQFTIASSPATARVFTPFMRDSRYVIPIDDTFDAAPTISYDAVGNGDYTVAVTGFRLLPANAPARGRPYTEILLDIGSYVPIRDDSVQVTSTFGWTAVPSTITNACLVQAARFFKRRDAPFGVAGNPDLGNELRLFAKVDPDVAVMVGTYKRPWGAV